jgi:hypothetical protein
MLKLRWVTQQQGFGRPYPRFGELKIKKASDLLALGEELRGLMEEDPPRFILQVFNTSDLEWIRQSKILVGPYDENSAAEKRRLCDEPQFSS